MLQLPRIAIALLLSGCTAGPTGYVLVGQFEAPEGLVVADVNRNLFHGEAEVNGRREGGGPLCNGRSQRTFSPLIALGCEGVRGRVELQCTGRGKVVANWVATSCDAGFGESAEEDVNGFTFAFGKDLGETRARLERLAR